MSKFLRTWSLDWHLLTNSFEKMVESIKAIKLLKGVRGETPSDLDAVVDNAATVAVDS